MISATFAAAFTGVVLQFQFILEPIPWYFPGTLIAGGLLLYATPYVDAFLGARLPEWRSLPAAARISTLGLLVGGAGLTVLATLGGSTWMYVLFLLGYARAVEAATILHLFGRIEELIGMLSAGGGGDTSVAKRALSWVVRRFKKRLPLVVTTVLLSIISLGLYVSTLFAFPGSTLWAKLAFAFTLSTFYLSTVNTAWVLRKLSDDIGPGAFVGIVFCVVGGELYNVPSTFAVFANQPALSGPMGDVTTLIVSTVGWLLGLVPALAFFSYRIQDTSNRRSLRSERRHNW